MKRSLLFLIAYLLAASPTWATWTLTSHPAPNTSCPISQSTCSLTFTVTAGRAGILVVANKSASFISSVSGGGTWLLAAGCQNVDNPSDAHYYTVSCAYNLSTSAASAETITWNTPLVATQVSVFYFEASFSSPAILFDTSGSSNITTLMNPPGQALSLTQGGNDWIVQLTSVSSGSITGISGPYADYSGTARASADVRNTNDGTAPTWSTSASIVEGVVAAIALWEPKLRHRVWCQ